MLNAPAECQHRRNTIFSMTQYAKKDSTGKRVKWAREDLNKWKQDVVASRVGIGVVYLSAIENDKRRASRDVMAKLAEVLGVSRAFLEMETDIPDPLPGEPAAVAPSERDFLHDETYEAAQYMDAMTDDLRVIALDIIRVLAMHDEDTDADTNVGGKSGRLVVGKYLGDKMRKSAPSPRLSE